MISRFRTVITRPATLLRVAREFRVSEDKPWIEIDYYETPDLKVFPDHRYYWMEQISATFGG